VRPFQLPNLRSKLIFSFLGVALLPLLLLAWVNQRTTQKTLMDNANQTLLSAASQTALSLDAFIKTNLDTVRVEAQLPILAKYLSLPASQRQTIAAEVEAALLALSRKDTLNISSYALIDRQGRDILDTYTPDIGIDKSDRNYFQEPLKTGLPYVSPLQYSPTEQSSSLYFSSPVRNALGQMIGVLRIRYKAAAIQRLVVQNTELVGGRESFAILLDENYIHLAHGTTAELNFKSITPLSPIRVKALQAEGRLPKGSAADLSTNLPTFERGLANANTTRFFTTPLALAGDDKELYSVAVTKLKTRPWFVVFVQPQAEFLAPIKAQIRYTLLLALVIVGVVIIAAVTIGQLLAKPLIHLASAVTSFTAGDLSARSSIQSQDEIGLLASSFNTMAMQVGKLLQGLEERTQELEVSQHVTVAVSELSRAIRDPKRLLQEAIALMQNRFGLHYVQIYLLDPKTQQLVKQADSGDQGMMPEQSPYLSLACSESIIVRAAQTKETIWIDDIHCEFKADSKSFQLCSEIAIPLISRGTLLGVMDIQNDQSDRFSQMDLETFNTLAGQIATALENAHLFEEIQKAELQYREKASELEEALHELKRTQTQLIQTEKMSSLGQLVAGVAHEINNPVNFIYGNLSYVSDYAEDLLSLIDLYQQCCPDYPQILERTEEIELDFLIEDLPKTISSIKLGAERIRQIVLTLRNFSRLDEAEMKPVDIHEGIESTLLILQNRLKAAPERPGIEIVKEYGDLPEVECYAGQLNQVFMNLISNGIDALQEYSQERDLETIKNHPPTITIRTQVSEQNGVQISIIDNGAGISDLVKARLFDPFFTTKKVGEGTGLGLSISYQIVVDKHRGQMQCFSTRGEGAEFRVEIPIKQQKVAALSR
jgi:signal transduction histidine kinase/HAMP domain-containing protein